jgi:hypothetical protein
MSEFELRRRLQTLKVERHPKRDLWPDIAARLEAPAWQPVRAPRRVMLPWAAVAAVALTVVAGVWLASHLKSMVDAREPAAVAAASPSSSTSDVPALLRGEALALEASYDGAIASVGGQRSPLAQGAAPPELEAAARELDAATAQLHEALASEPDAKYLVELLKRTQARRLALAKLGLRSA